MLTENSFQDLSNDISEIAEDVTLSILKKLRQIAKRLTKGQSINDEQFNIEVNRLWEQYFSQSVEWTDQNVSKAYLRGIENVEGKVSGAVVAGAFSRSGPMVPTGGGGSIADRAKEILERYPQHHTMYSVFQDSAYNDFLKTRVPVVRDARGKIRELIILASETQYTQADTFTRLQFSQDLMNRFADDNITGIVYSDGRTMKLDTYSEMVARSQTGNAARQASINRQQEYGLDLVQITQHFPCSPLCEPHQGKVYSLSGTDPEYPSFDTTNPGSELYHANCKHYQAAFIPGTSELPPEGLNKEENLKQYKAEQRQRTIERKIRHYKRREAVAVTEKAQNDAKNKIREWQKAQREHVDKWDHLRRKYPREQV